MLADEQNYINLINSLDITGLREKCIRLYLENKELHLNQSANEKINTESYLQYKQLKEDNDKLKQENKELKELLEKEVNKNSLRARTTFGRKTEKTLSLIDAADNKVSEFEDESATEDTDSVAIPSRSGKSNVVSASTSEKKANSSTAKVNCEGNKTKINRLKQSLNNLPRQISYDIDVDALNKKYGKGNWRIAFWHAHEVLEKIDTPYYVNVIYTPTISVGLEHRLYTESYENPLIDKSVVSESILSDILCRKYILSLPANRQAVDYQMQGINLSKQTIINWMANTVPQFIEPVAEYMAECLVKYKYTQNDETYIQVNKDERGPGHKSFMWVHASSEYLDCNPIIVFCYEKTRNTDHLRSFYKEFMGYITCDAYCSYQVLEGESQGNIMVGGCLMHARRYFAEAFFINDISSLSNDQLKELPETKVLLMIRDIYIEERPLKDMTADKRLAIRKEKVSPLVDHFFNYVHELKDSGEVFTERMEKAINYSINQEQHLRLFLTDGNICCDNGHAERCIRAYSVGRANWLFADTVFGAELNATMYSVVSTAKANGVNVKIYLRYLLEKMPKHKSDTDRSYLETMMPWSEEYKQYEKDYLETTMNIYHQVFPEPERPKTPKKNSPYELGQNKSA